MVHKPKHNVHSFRGLLGDGGQDEINLERQNVNMAYRLIKLQLISYNMNEDVEHVVQVFREEQTAVSNVYDFDNTDLLGAAFIRVNKTAPGTNISTIVFDNTLFSRNIFVTHDDVGGSAVACNYYLEIEEVPVNAATLMQLKLGVARKLSLSESAPDA